MSRTQRLTLDFETPAAMASSLTERPLTRRGLRPSSRSAVFIMDNIPADSDGGDCTNTLERVLVPRESARPGSNRCQDLGRVLCYHYTTGAAGKDYPGSLELAQIGLVDGAAAQIEIEPCRPVGARSTSTMRRPGPIQMPSFPTGGVSCGPSRATTLP